MKTLRRLTLILVAVVVVSAVAYGVGWGLHPAGTSSDAQARDQVSGDTSPSTMPPSTSTLDQSPSATQTAPTGPTSEPTEQPPRAEPTPEPELQAGPAIYAPGDQSEEVRALQARLRQIDWFQQSVTGTYGDVTTAAVRGFQAKRGIPVTGEVDQRTWDRLVAMTSEPTQGELDNLLGDNVPGALDPRCLHGRAICIDKTSRTLRWLVDGSVQKTVDVRFGSEYTPTREGAFRVEYKSRDHVSRLYGSSMPFAMFFSGGQAVHYSSDFAAVGYNGASHGCVNVRDYDAVAWLFDQVDVGDPVIVYRS